MKKLFKFKKEKNTHTLSYKESRAIIKSNFKITKEYEKKKKAKVSKEAYTTTMKDSQNALEIDNLHTYFFTDNGVVKSVNGISFDVPKNKIVGLVGESGCGKSVTSLSIMQLVQAPQGQIVEGEITVEVIEQDGGYYQYTGIDEYTRQRVLWASKEQSTSASTEFIGVMMRKFKFKIECIQTDNGFEFTNRLNWQGTKKKTMFEKKLEELEIRHKLIKPKTPRHNGKVERSHRKDQERFYYKKVFCSFEDFKNRLKYWEKEYNNFPMKPLGWKSPNEKLKEYELKKSA